MGNVGNCDASPLFDGRGNGAGVQHGLAGRAGSIDGVDLPVAVIGFVPAWHNHTITGTAALPTVAVTADQKG